MTLFGSLGYIGPPGFPNFRNYNYGYNPSYNYNPNYDPNYNPSYNPSYNPNYPSYRDPNYLGNRWVNEYRQDIGRIRDSIGICI
jgi:hypothetical protein